MSLGKLRSCVHAAAAIVAALCVAPIGIAGDFEFGTMIRAGLSGNSDHELAIGTTAASPSATGQVNPYFNGSNQLFEIGYLKATNTAYVRVHQNLSPASAYSQVSFNPVGGAAAPVDAIWRLPAASFFARATDSSGVNLVSISNLTLSGVSGSLDIIQPIQSTSLLAYQLGGFAQPSVSQSQEVVFRADSGGNWKLQGSMLVLGLLSNGGVASGSEIEFGVTAIAGTPEPASAALAMLGVAGMVAFARKRSMRK